MNLSLIFSLRSIPIPPRPTRPPIILHLQRIRSPLTQDQIILPSQNQYAPMDST